MQRTERTRKIPRLVDEQIIRGFFGDQAKSYDYEVTQDDFDEYDNEAPGTYYGVAVPATLADRWDAGIEACQNANVKTRSREGLLMRYRIMVEDDTADLPSELLTYLEAREVAEATEQRKKDAAERKEADEKAELTALLSGLIQVTVGPAKSENCTFGGDGMRVLRRGNAVYTEGMTSDGRRVVSAACQQFDDYRTYYYAPEDIATKWLLAYADSNDITVEQAESWLAKYNGCHGSDLYSAVVARAAAVA